MPSISVSHPRRECDKSGRIVYYSTCSAHMWEESLGRTAMGDGGGRERSGRGPSWMGSEGEREAGGLTQLPVGRGRGTSLPTAASEHKASKKLLFNKQTPLL